MANGILAHSDETDDSHAPSGTHPGCAVVPAALAMGEKNDCSGEALLKSVVLGYDVGEGGTGFEGMHHIGFVVDDVGEYSEKAL